MWLNVWKPDVSKLGSKTTTTSVTANDSSDGCQVLQLDLGPIDRGTVFWLGTGTVVKNSNVVGAKIQT